MYSGTVGAVLAADHLCLPAIALSQAFHARDAVDFSATRGYATAVIETLWARREDYGCCWNINFPMQTPERIRGLRFTRQVGGAMRAPRLIAGTDGRGMVYHWLTFERDSQAVIDPGSDVAALRDDYISAMPLRGTRCDEALCKRAGADGEWRLRTARQDSGEAMDNRD